MVSIAVSVTDFKLSCVDVIRRVEQEGAAVDLTRSGRVVARLVPMAAAPQGIPTWLRLRGRGRLHAQPQESVLDATAFDAARGRVV